LSYRRTCWRRRAVAASGRNLSPSAGNQKRNFVHAVLGGASGHCPPNPLLRSRMGVRFGVPALAGFSELQRFRRNRLKPGLQTRSRVIGGSVRMRPVLGQSLRGRVAKRTSAYGCWMNGLGSPFYVTCAPVVERTSKSVQRAAPTRRTDYRTPPDEEDGFL